jgi:sigma-E factor negative regulatory protein RseB
MFTKKSYVFILSAFLSVPLHAAESLHSLLDQMNFGVRNLNYQGHFSYQQGDELQSLRIAHALVDGEGYERLEYMDGEPREVIRRGTSLSYLYPSQRLIRNLSLQEQQGDVASSENIAQYYQLLVAGWGRIAGRPVVNIILKPKDKHRLMHNLSLDKETGLLLKSALLSSDNKVLERFQFVDISIGDDVVLSPDEISRIKAASKVASPSAATEAGEAAKPETPRAWKVQWLPDGYTATIIQDDSAGQDMATFTDGLAVFSVFLEVDTTGSVTVEGYSRRGATIAYSRPIILEGIPRRVTVVGEIPRQTARQIAQSVTFISSR